MIQAKLKATLKHRLDQLRSLLVSVMAADWSYEKAFYYITVGIVLLSLLLKALNLIGSSFSGGDFVWSALLLSLTILAIAFFLAFGTRLLIRAIKKDLKPPHGK